MLAPIYQSGLVTLYHGDALAHPELWLSAAVLVTDPPYGISYTGRRVRPKISGDEGTAIRDEALALWGAARPALVFGSRKRPRPEGTKALIQWHKRNSGVGMGDLSLPWGQGGEEIYVLGDWTGRQGKRAAPYVTTEVCLGSRGGLAVRVGHPTPKPVELMTELLSKCPPGTVADPFAGSGSTLVAAVRTGRRCVGVEMDSEYAEIAAMRIRAAETGAPDLAEIRVRESERLVSPTRRGGAVAA